ncbi:MAG: FHA domain-containing protein [bacterium]|nr:FHA domain-containing protein [bacterium]
MGFLKDFEKFLEEKFEGQSVNSPHVLEAVQKAGRIMIDGRYRHNSSLTLVPNHVIIPFEFRTSIPKGFEEEVKRLLTISISERGYKTLSPLCVHAVVTKKNTEMGVYWENSEGCPIEGFIIGEEGPAQGGVWSIFANGTIVGRSQEAGVRWADAGLSRRHLFIEACGDKIKLEDLGSSAGTFIGKKQITAPALVKSGAKIRLARSIISVWLLPWTKESAAQ